MALSLKLNTVSAGSKHLSGGPLAVVAIGSEIGKELGYSSATWLCYQRRGVVHWLILPMHTAMVVARSSQSVVVYWRKIRPISAVYEFQYL